jgi:drug/metabolite transporter (DMT)-like permease
VTTEPSASLSAERASVARLALTAATASVVMQSIGPLIVRKISLSGLSVGFNRLWIGAIVFSVALLARRGRLSWRLLVQAAPGGILYGLNIAAFFTGVKHTSVANAATITALQPVVLLLVVNRIFGEKPAPRQFVFTAASIAGVALVVRGSSQAQTGDAWGDLLSLLSMFLFAAYYVASKRARETLGALEYQTGLMFSATLVLIPFAFLSGAQVAVTEGSDWIWLAMLVALPGTGHLLTNYSFPHLPLIVPSVLTLFVPVGSTITAALFLDEPLVGLQIVGIVVVVLSLAIMITGDALPWPRRRRPTPSPTPTGGPA